jgi:hypothetical protein
LKQTPKRNLAADAKQKKLMQTPKPDAMKESQIRSQTLKGTCCRCKSESRRDAKAKLEADAKAKLR